MTPYRLRKAIQQDIPALEALIQLSVRQLCTRYYSNAQAEAALHHGFFGVDSELITDGTYFVIQQATQLIACGGWSKRQTLFGANHSQHRQAGRLNPACDAARIRAFFLHPDHAGQGLGQHLLQHCEAEAIMAGFQRSEMMATLSGKAFYARHGYHAEKECWFSLTDDMQINGWHMHKALIHLPSEMAG